jgi:hypothetical protein
MTYWKNANVSLVFQTTIPPKQRPTNPMTKQKILEIAEKKGACDSGIWAFQ